MSPERAVAGTRVRVREHHRRESLRGLTGKVLGRYGRSAYVAVDVRLSNGPRQLFWPRDSGVVSAKGGPVAYVLPDVIRTCFSLTS